jgi:hypothetical protein
MVLFEERMNEYQKSVSDKVSAIKGTSNVQSPFVMEGIKNDLCL